MRFQEEECAVLQQIEDAALKRLQDHWWPGNVRELQSVIRAAVVRSREDPQETILRARHLPPFAGPELSVASEITNFEEYPTWRDAAEGFHREWVRWALQRCGSAAEVGRRFKVDQKTIKRYRSST
jgi:transcriptional regulator with PAS, ATPase and Fis domain